MGTIYDKLNYLVDTKARISTAIVGKGQSVLPTDTFRSYAEKITNIEGGGTVIPNAAFISSNASEVTSNTTLTSTIYTVAGNLVVAAVVHRSLLDSVPVGWTQLYQVKGSFGSSTQYTSVFYKFANTTSTSITVTQVSSGRIYINLHTFQDAAAPQMYTQQTVVSAASVPFTVHKGPEKTVMWIVYSYLYISSSPYPLWVCSKESCVGTQLGTSTQSRLYTVVDDTKLIESYTIKNESLDDPANYFGIIIPGKAQEPSGKKDVSPTEYYVNYYTTSSNFRYEVNDDTRSAVIPLKIGSYYIIKNVTVGNRLRITTLSFDPRTKTSDTTIGGRVLYESSSPTANTDLFIEAKDGESFLNIYFTNSGQDLPNIIVYEIT